MFKTISAYMNVALADYDESMKNHMVELLKESLREQSTEYLLEDMWEVVVNKRKLYKNEDGTMEIQDLARTDIAETRDILEVMTVVLTGKHL